MKNLLETAKSLRMDFFAEKMEDFLFEKVLFFQQPKNKLIEKFDKLYQSLPDINTKISGFEKGFVSVGSEKEISKEDCDLLHNILKEMKPWRKGPFRLFGIEIDSEWNSFLKWQRFENYIDIKDKKILDIGSSNGYYLFKMSEQKPLISIGIEPFIPYYYQFRAIRKYLNTDNIFTIPVSFDALPEVKGFYDYIFCMGVLYHRKCPMEMLAKIKRIMADDGVLILETLIIPGNENIALVPEKRYAAMNNVHFIPTLKTLEIWLKKSGFHDIFVLDITRTSIDEQRRTPWTFEKSLVDFLDCNDKNKTVEGYSAPIRAVIKAKVL